jgi:hypothetical protein
LLATQEGYSIIKWQQVFKPGSQVEKLVLKNAIKLTCGENFYFLKMMILYIFFNGNIAIE